MIRRTYFWVILLSQQISPSPLRRACRLKNALDRARTAFLDVLDDYTLADLTGNPDFLKTSLGLAVPPN